MKKHIVILLLFFHFSLKSQTKVKPAIELIYYLGAKFGFLKGNSFQNFVNSYNQIYNTNKSKLTNFGLATGCCTEFELISNFGLYAGIYVHRISTTASTKINDFSTRKFQLNQNSTAINIGYTKKFKRGGFAVFTGIYYINYKLVSVIEFRDGYQGISKDEFLNGVYNTNSLSSCLGAKIYRYHNRFGAMAAIRWQPTLYSTWFYDYLYDRFIPEDLGTILPKGHPQYYDINYVSDRFQFISLDFGISINIYKKNLKRKKTR